MNVGYLIARLKTDNSIVDILWGLGFVVVSWSLFLSGTNPMNPFLMLMVSLWGLRLGAQLYFRNKREGEDWRYKAWRKDWGEKVNLIAYFRIFMLQGVFMFLISMPLVPALPEGYSPGVIAWAGIILWFIGFSFESIADYQLYRFKGNPENKGKVLDTGLWKYSRHPNYFGEILLWWGIGIYVFSYAGVFFGFLGPLIISLLLIFVSGVPMTERKTKKNPKYHDYIERTNTLIPLPPKKARKQALAN